MNTAINTIAGLFEILTEIELKDLVARLRRDRTRIWVTLADEFFLADKEEWDAEMEREESSHVR